MESTKKLCIISSGENEAVPAQIDIIVTLPVHLRDMAQLMRPADRQELVSFGISPEKALWRSYKSSVVRRTAYINGNLAAVWGVSGTFMGEIGQPWLLTTEEIKKISPLKFARIYQKEVKEMLTIFPKLMNIVDASYTSAIRLLDIVGFRIQEPEAIGKNGALYRIFEMGA